MIEKPRRRLARVVPAALRAAAVAAVLGLGVLPAAAQAGDDNAPTPWIYPLPDGSALTLQIPPDWAERSSSGTPGQVHFSGGSHCEVQVAITLVAGSDPPLDNSDAVRALVDADARDYIDRAVEGHYTLRELRGPEAAGWYFALRQRQPERKGSPFVSRGAVHVGGAVLRFSVETPKPDQPEVRQALKMLAEAKEMRAAPARVPDPPHPETTAAAPPSLVSLYREVPLRLQAPADPPDPEAPMVPAGPPASKAKPSEVPAESGSPPVSAVASVLTLAPGAKGEARLILSIHKGTRILAHEQTGQYMQGALLAVEAVADVLPEEPIFPAGTAWRYRPDDPEVKTYEGTVVVRVPVHAKAGSTAGSRVLKGRLRYQAIEDGMFKKTAVLPITIPITVGKGAPEKN
jgi:hypothetical protein